MYVWMYIHTYTHTHAHTHTRTHIHAHARTRGVIDRSDALDRRIKVVHSSLCVVQLVRVTLVVFLLEIIKH